MQRSTGWMLGLGLVLGSLCWAEADDLIGKGPTEEEIGYATSREASARTYVECLQTEKVVWLSTPDYGKCDGPRDLAARYFPPDAAGVVLGCMEERVLGASREAGQSCEAFGKRFVRPTETARAAEEAAP